MDMNALLQRELQGSLDFFLDFTNLNPQSRGFGLTVDSTKKPEMASIAASGFALTAWVIGCERGLMHRQRALEIIRGTLHTLLHHVDHHRGFFTHFAHMDSAERWEKCEYSTIDTGLCLNGVLTADAYFQDEAIHQMAQELLERVDWRFIIFETDDQTRFRMAYNPDRDGAYAGGQAGFIGQWDMAAEQKMMYLQAANRVEPEVARRLYAGFKRDTGRFDDQDIIITPGGTLFVYHFADAWLDTGRYLDPDGVDWFNNTRLAALANRQFCIEHAAEFKTYHANSWGLSAGDSPRGYEVAHGWPSLFQPQHTGTVSIYSALSSLPYTPEETLAMIEYLYTDHPRTWGNYGFFDSYNLAVDPPWYSHSVYGIDKGCSMLMVENYLSGLVWNVYTNSPYIQNALRVLNFARRPEAAS